MSKPLFFPSRCTAFLPEDLTKPYLVAEEKLDGSRYVLYLGYDPYGRQPSNTVLSRRPSKADGKLVDRTNNLPHITGQEYKGLEGTVLDGEVFTEDKDHTRTSAILNSSPINAVNEQKNSGFLIFNAFDVLSFRGKDVRGLPLEKRRKVLEEIVKRMENPFVKTIPQIKTGIEDYFLKIVQGGGEGVIVKDIRQGYGQGWAKMKKSYDVSCIISGYKEGNGRYAGMVGALALSVYNGSKLVEVGFASGFSDAKRKEYSDNFHAFKGTVVDVFAQELTKASIEHACGRLRHPTFYRERSDIDPKTVTFEKLKADFKEKARNNRFKKD